MGAIVRNGIMYGGAPTIRATAGAHINQPGTPTVTTTTAQGVTTLTFDYLKGEAASSEAEDINYDNTTSGMTADNTQDALDELSAGKANGAGIDLIIRDGGLIIGYDDGQ